MRSTKKAHKKTYYSSGAQGASEAHNTAPKAHPAQGIAGFSSTKTASKASGTSGPGTSNPMYGGGASGYGKTGKGAPKRRTHSGPSMSGSGPTKTDQGTCCPKYGSGPGGLGRTGRGAPGPR